jgi:RNA polymerase sigma-70 factor, ECF subfamily
MPAILATTVSAMEVRPRSVTKGPSGRVDTSARRPPLSPAPVLVASLLVMSGSFSWSGTPVSRNLAANRHNRRKSQFQVAARALFVVLGRRHDEEVEQQPEEVVSRQVCDSALVRAARLGDAEAFAVIVERHGPAMYRYAVRLLHDEADAAEVVQEAFLSAWKNLHTFQGRSSLRTWLFRLVSRRAADLQRVRRPIPISDDFWSAMTLSTQDDPLQQALDAELLQALRYALAELPWHQRATWLLREVEAMSYGDIATTLALPVGSVRGHLHRARKTLAERMARWR